MSNVTLIGGRQRLLVIDGTPWFVVADLPSDIRRSDIKSLFGNSASYDRGLCCAPVVANRLTVPAVSAEGLTDLLIRVSERCDAEFAFLTLAKVFQEQQNLYHVLMDGLWRLDRRSASADFETDVAKRDTFRCRLCELVGLGAKAAILEAECVDKQAEIAWLRALPDHVLADLVAQTAPTAIALH
jgi:hypothetical protein